MARKRRGSSLTWPLALVAASALALQPSCLLCGGQTGECGAADNDGGGSPCGIYSRGIDDPTVNGYTPADLLAALSGEYSSTVTLPDASGTPGTPTTLTVGIAYVDGAITEDACAGTVAIDVVVTLTAGDLTLSRSGTATFTGTPDAATLTIDVFTSGADRPEPAHLVLTVTPGTLVGTLTLGAAAPVSFTATR